MELEALASRKFKHYRAYVRLHQELSDCTDLEQCSIKCKELIDNFLDNRLIWEELNYYQLHGSLLGKHPAFAEFRRRNDLRNLSTKELVRRQEQVENNIWRVKNEMAKGNKPHLDVVRKERLAGYEKELADINKLLDE